MPAMQEQLPANVHGWTVCRQCRSNCRRMSMDGRSAGRSRPSMASSALGLLPGRNAGAISGDADVGWALTHRNLRCRIQVHRDGLCRSKTVAKAHPTKGPRRQTQGGPWPTAICDTASRCIATACAFDWWAKAHPTTHALEGDAIAEKAILATRQRRRDRFWLRCSKILRRIPRFQARVFSVTGFISSGEFA